MELNINEIKYNNRIKEKINEFKVSANQTGVVVGINNGNIEGQISFSFDDIRILWAKLLESDKSKSREVNEHFSDNLSLANNLANRLSLDNYKEDSEKLEDMKHFVAVFSDLVEHAKFGILAAKNLETQQKNLIDEKTKIEHSDIIEKKKLFDDEAKKTSEQFESRFPQKRFSGDAISFEQLLLKMEEEKNKIREEDQKRFEELKKQAEEKKELITPKQNIRNKDNNEIHVNSDFVKVEPLMQEINTKELKMRSKGLDIIDYTKL
jgi:hypothetical protein